MPVCEQVTGQGNNVRYCVAGCAVYHFLCDGFPNRGKAGPGRDRSGKGRASGRFVRETLCTAQASGPGCGGVVAGPTG